MMDKEVIQIEKEQNMLLCADNSKTFCSNYYPPQDVKLLSLQMWANNMFPHTRKSLPKVPTKVKKENDENTISGFAKTFKVLV